MKSKSADLYNQLLNDPTRPYLQYSDGQLEGNYPSFFERWMNNQHISDCVPTFHVFSGSFNPFHEGHRAIWDTMKTNVPKGGILLFEVSIYRKGKTPYSYTELKQILAGLEWKGLTFITNSAEYKEKAGLFPYRPTFHMGSDTASRLIYDEGVIGVQGINADFIVYKRDWDEKIIKCPSNMTQCELIREIPFGISSTKIRQEKQNEICYV